MASADKNFNHSRKLGSSVSSTFITNHPRSTHHLGQEIVCRKMSATAARDRLGRRVTQMAHHTNVIKLPEASLGWMS